MKLPGSVHTAPDTEALFEKLGESLLANALDSVEKRGVFHLALSGGGTPEPFYMRLVTDPMFRLLPWQKTHVWIVDERRVPEDHDKANIKMIRESLMDHVPMPVQQLHAMPVLSATAADDYEAQLAEAFGIDGKPSAENAPSLDFILLGMGGDCHTASLFPESPALEVRDRWIVGNDGEKVVPPPRLTMTYPLLNAGRELAVLAVGGGKREALRRVADQHATGEPDPRNIPITGLRPTRGHLTWYLDDAAAG